MRMRFLQICFVIGSGLMLSGAQFTQQVTIIPKRGVELVPDAFPQLRTDQAEPPIQTQVNGTGLTIVPTFDAGIDAASLVIINNAIAFYKTTFSDNLTVHIYFYNMNSGLGSSLNGCYGISYPTFRAALAAHASSSDDATALANTPNTNTTPINGSSSLCVKPANGLVLGLNTPEFLFNFGGSPCPSFTGSGCIGINIALANSYGILTSVTEHEIDEVLGLGSALPGTTDPWPEDLFRWANAGTRSYATNASTTNPCTSTPSAFFSLNGGVTNLNQFNNCNNGGDYGDWISHAPGQVQDAFASLPLLTLTNASSEVRALDALGYTVVLKKVHGQITSSD
jgi:hypothetical protein